MDKDYEKKYHLYEQNYWWFKTRRDIIFNIIKKNKKKAHILEIGCSGGPLLTLLKKKGYNNITGIDISKTAIENCKKKNLKNVFIMDAIQTDFKNQQFDIIIASDILEHIDNDNKAILEWNRILKKNGIIIIFVPAFHFLWSNHDELNHHKRRYTKQLLNKLLIKYNFEILKSSYWNFSLFFPMAFIRIIQKKLFKDSKNKKDSLYKINTIINNILTKLLLFENKILLKKNFPIGISVFSICKKK